MDKIKTIKEELTKRGFPIVGDFVKLPDGRVGRISVLREGQKTQLVGHENITVFLQPGAYPTSASGCTWDPDFDDIDFDHNDLRDTGERKLGSAWTFMPDVGQGNGYHFEAEFKIWELS